MKILCVIDGLGSGGAQKQLTSLALGFQKKGHDVKFLTYHQSDFFLNRLHESNISVHCIDETNWVNRIIRIKRYLKNNDQDIVLSFLDTPNVICEITGLPWRKWKLIVSERSANPAILKTLTTRIIRCLHIFADHVVCNSFTNAEMIQKATYGIIQKKTKVIYNLVDNINNVEENVEYIARRDGKLHLLIAASHQYLKNAKGLVQAINFLPHSYKSKLKVDWYGEQECKSVIEPYVEVSSLIHTYKLEGIIEFHKPTKDLLYYIKNADAVGLFSFYEGLPNIICEAMSCSKPIISTRVSDLPLLIEDEISGYISETCEAESIKNALQKLLNCSNEKLYEMGKINYKKARLLFNEYATLDEYEKLFNT